MNLQSNAPFQRTLLIKTKERHLEELYNATNDYNKETSTLVNSVQDLKLSKL